MVSFSCEACNDTLKKKDLDKHKGRCRGASFTCLDCMHHFPGSEYRSHTSCISEAQKYEGHLYRDKKKGQGNNKNNNNNNNNKGQSLNGHDASQAMIPRKAYVEDAPESVVGGSNTIAVVDVPPKAPSPPPAPENVNVFDFLVTEETPKAKKHALNGPDESRMLESQSQQYYTPHTGDSQYSQYSAGDGSQYLRHGFSYGDAPIPPAMDRYDSYPHMTGGPNPSLMPPPYATPAPKESRKERKSEKSDKKRKRHQVDELDLTSSSTVKRPSSSRAGADEHMPDAPPTATRVLHSGLTGGLSKLVTDPDFYADRIEAGPTPISPVKRSKRTASTTADAHRDRDRDDRDSRKDRRKSSYTSYSTTTTSTATAPPVSRPPSTRPTTDRHRSYDTHSRSSSASSVTPAPHHHHARDRSSRSVQPPSRHHTALTTNPISRADHFLSLVTKGPDSSRGCSVNKVLKRYHREADGGGVGGEGGDKELWKGLRLRRNSRGEVVVFM